MGQKTQETSATFVPESTTARTFPSPEGTTNSPRVNALRRELHVAVERAERYAKDLSNLKRHTEAESRRTRVCAQQELLAELGDTLRNLELALASGIDDKQPIRQGVAMVLRGLEAVYERHDLERIPSDGQAFDPLLHEAVMAEESLDHAPGTIVREIAPGFRTASGRVIRPARVSVARS